MSDTDTDTSGVAIACCHESTHSSPGSENTLLAAMLSFITAYSSFVPNIQEMIKPCLLTLSFAYFDCTSNSGSVRDTVRRSAFPQAISLSVRKNANGIPCVHVLGIPESPKWHPYVSPELDNWIKYKLLTILEEYDPDSLRNEPARNVVYRQRDVSTIITNPFDAIGAFRVNPTDDFMCVLQFLPGIHCQNIPIFGNDGPVLIWILLHLVSGPIINHERNQDILFSEQNVNPKEFLQTFKIAPDSDVAIQILRILQKFRVYKEAIENSPAAKTLVEDENAPEWKKHKARLFLEEVNGAMPGHVAAAAITRILAEHFGLV